MHHNKTNQAGPVTENARWLHELKYRTDGEDFSQAMTRIADALTSNEPDFRSLRALLLDQSFLPAGRIQSSVGTGRAGATAHNCFVSQTIEDNSESIMAAVTAAFQTLRTGGGIGYNFSKLRPAGARIKSIGSVSSGPVSFMHIFDAVCKTVSAAGHRRGAQMGCLDVSHPDIVKFINAKTTGNQETLSAFNMSVFMDDEFMHAVDKGHEYALSFEGHTHETIKARKLYDNIMRNTWDWAEPGLLFRDTINRTNNLWYCEELRATNPCGEQPLPPHGACLLGSMNITKYVRRAYHGSAHPHFYYIDLTQLKLDVNVAVRALDAVMEESRYPLPEQQAEAMNKRRIGLGVTGMASALTTLGGEYAVYGSTKYIGMQEEILIAIRDQAYTTSVELAKEKGPFPLFDADKYLCPYQGTFASTLPVRIQHAIRDHGIRNSHLLSIAPTGTISMCADNVSSGIEPVFSVTTTRTIQTEEGPKIVTIEDYALMAWGLRAQEASTVTADQHLAVLASAQKFVDSAVSKTCNVSPDMPWADFKELYIKAWKLGCKGITTFNSGGKRFGMMAPTALTPPVDGGAVCNIDPITGAKDCGE